MGDDQNKNELQKQIDQIAHEVGIYVEAVPLERFIPLPENAILRSLYIGTFGKVEVFIFDPYSIAFSKVDRGFDTDLDDVAFLLQRELIEISELMLPVHDVMRNPRGYDIHPLEMLNHFREVKNRFKGIREEQ